MKRWCLAALVGALLGAGSATAQEALSPQATPNFAALYLEAGFPLDPYLVRVESSGTLDAAAVQAGCVGVVPASPDVVVNWLGATDQLSFFVYSDVDPTLLVVTPSGEVLCNDDWNDATLSPVVTVASPAEGAYAVYVGAYSAEQRAYGWLGVTEMSAEALNIAAADLTPMLRLRPAISAAALEARPAEDLQAGGPPIFGEAELEPGFGAHEAAVTGAGVEVAATFALGEQACAGYINLAPSYRFSLAEAADGLAVYFNGPADTVLVAQLPDGAFVCSANAGEDNLNPLLTLDAAPAGGYSVWVGVMTPESVAPGTLVINEDLVAQPALLAAGQ